MGLLGTMTDAVDENSFKLIFIYKGLSNDGVGVARGSVLHERLPRDELLSKLATSLQNNSWGRYR